MLWSKKWLSISTRKVRLSCSVYSHSLSRTAHYSLIFKGNSKLSGYLTSEWVSCKSYWCQSYMRSVLNTWRIHTNNHIESFHRVLKYTRMEKRKVRLDAMIQLLRSSISSHFQRVLRLHDLTRVREVLSKKIIEAKSLYIERGRVRCENEEEGTYEVTSKAKDNTKYNVHLLTPEGPSCTCPTNSALQCVHILAAALSFPRAHERGLDPSMPRAYSTSVEGDVSDTEESKTPGESHSVINLYPTSKY